MTKDGLLDQAPANGPFRIHIVSEMTGVPEPTLRAWERRYGLPSPERTASGYRLYSLREVEQVRAMRAACDGGMSAAEAARWVRSSSGKVSESELAPLPATTDVFANARDDLLEAVAELNDQALEEQLRKLMFLGSAVQILDQVLRPTLIEIGDRWYAGSLTVAHEHFASHHIGNALRDLLRLNTSPSGDRVLVAAFADDEHEIGGLGLALHVASWGLRPTFLGARTPPSAVRNAIEQVSPTLVALSATLTPEPPRARELIDDYASACGDVPFIVGGAAKKSLADVVRKRGGQVDPGDPGELRSLVHKLMSARAPSKAKR